MTFDNERYVSSLIKRTYWTLLFVILIVSALALFFAKKWWSIRSMDNVYVLDSDHTYTATKSDGSRNRSDHEISIFSQYFLEKAFAHNEYTWEENLSTISEFMDKESAYFFLSKMDETIESLYKERNAISTVKLLNIEINRETFPCEVLLHYTTFLKFSSASDVVYENLEVPGCVYFRIEPMERSKKNPFGMQIRELKFLSSNVDQTRQ